MSRGYYARRTDDRLITTAHTIAGSDEDAEYPAVYLSAESPRPAKLTTTSGWWVIDFGSAPGDIVAAVLVQQYLDAALDVRIQANDSDSWGTPAFEQAIVPPAPRFDGPSYQPWTHNAIAVFEDPQDFRYWRLLIAGTNSQPVQIGRLLLLSALRPVEVITDGSEVAEESDEQIHIRQQTELKHRLVTELAGPMGHYSGMFVGTDLGAGSAPVFSAADYRALWESAGGDAYPWLWWPFVGRPPMVVQFAGEMSQRTHRVGGYQVWPFRVSEVSRGLPWP